MKDTGSHQHDYILYLEGENFRLRSELIKAQEKTTRIRKALEQRNNERNNGNADLATSRFMHVLRRILDD